jgi:hypothetical protein
LKDGKDDADLGEEEGRADGASFDLENMDLDHPQHVPPDITVEVSVNQKSHVFMNRLSSCRSSIFDILLICF